MYYGNLNIKGGGEPSLCKTKCNIIVCVVANTILAIMRRCAIFMRGYICACMLAIDGFCDKLKVLHSVLDYNYTLHRVFQKIFDCLDLLILAI